MSECGRWGRVATAAVAMLLTALLAGCLPSSLIAMGPWTVTCTAVTDEDCEGVAGLFVNNLAWSEGQVLDESGGRVSVAPRPDCPALPDWADPAMCWQAWAPVADGRVCMVIAARPGAGKRTFGQVGGDDLTGRATDPNDPGRPPCR